MNKKWEEIIYLFSVAKDGSDLKQEMTERIREELDHDDAVDKEVIYNLYILGALNLEEYNKLAHKKKVMQ